jgi:diguanylate cyclase (GGDEF)-like protein/PAS domain S-box-containing protein
MKNLTKDIKLLYVEDEDELREETLEILEYYFQDIVVAKDGEEGLELYKREFESKGCFDIVISDIEMPKMDGILMCKKIKEINKDQIVVLLSAYDTKEHLKGAINLGVDKFIVKPVIDAYDFISSLVALSEKVLLKLEYKSKDFLLEQQHKIIEENVFMTVSDLDGKIVEVSKAYLDFTGFTRDEIIGKNHSVFREKSNKIEVIKDLWETILADKPWVGELKNRKFTKEEYWIKANISPLYNVNHEKIGYSAIVQDITNAKRLEALSITDTLTEIHNRKYFDYSLNREYKGALWRREKFALLIVDIDNFNDYNELYGNASGDKAIRAIALEIKKYLKHTVENVFRIGGQRFAIIVLNKSDKYIQKIALDLIERVDALKIKHEKGVASGFLSVSIGGINTDCSKETISNEDIYNLADNNLSKAKKSGKNKFIFNANDSSIESVKNLDISTKLPNRESLVRDLSLLQEDAMLILLHINQINSIKDIYGMQVVSEITSQKAKQLNRIIIDNSATLYCLNMQEFALLVTSKALFEKYMELVKYSILTNSDENSSSQDNGNSLVAEFSAGVSYGMLNIFSQADIALQDAIISKKNLIIYNNNQTKLESEKARLDRLKIYKRALNDGNIVPYFQPIIDVRDNSVMKYEALARLVTDDGEVVSPCHFLDSSKEDNTFEFFSRQMIQKVFNVYAKKKADISINLAYENINSPTMRDYIKNRLDKYGGEGITFEILESEDIEDYALIEDFIKMLKSYNCKISIDDFGSGYSNFTNIIKLDIDYIKLDGSLIEKINTDKNVEHMVVALLDFVKNAKIKTIAEFVSTKELDVKVGELGVDYIQGYLYGEPNTAENYGLL